MMKPASRGKGAKRLFSIVLTLVSLTAVGISGSHAAAFASGVSRVSGTGTSSSPDAANSRLAVDFFDYDADWVNAETNGAFHFGTQSDPLNSRSTLTPGIVSDTLDSSGNPAFAADDGTNTLDYLFEDSQCATARSVNSQQLTNEESTTEQSTLFDRDSSTGMYSFDSSQRIVSISSDGSVTNHKSGISSSVTATKAADSVASFLPFNSQSDVDSDGRYVYDGSADYLFGMKMTASFTQPTAGRIASSSSSSGADMTLSFSGNDDVWVFVDNHLAMDLGGLHDKASGSIDFSTGEISVNGAMQDSSLWSKLGVSGRFADGSSHTVSLFYLNRGATGSNAAINFNIPIDSVAASDSSPTEDGLSSGDPGVRKKTAVDSTSASNPDPGTSDSGTSNSGNQSDSSGDQPTGTAKTGATSTATSAASGTTTSAAPAAASICVSEMVLGTDHPHRSSDNVESLANPFQYKLTYQGYMNPDPNNPGGYTNLGGDPGTVAVANGAQAATVGTDGQLVDGVAVNAELASGDALWTVIPSTLTNGVASEPSSFGTFTFTKAGRYTFVIQHDPVSGYNMESSTVWDRSANTYTVYADVSAGASGALQASVSYIPGSTGDEDGDGDADTADALAARIVSIEGLYDATAVENLKKILSGDSIESFNDWSAAVYLTAYHGDGVVMPTKVSHTNCNCLATPVGETISSLPLTGAAVTYNEILGVGGGIFLAAAVAYAVVVLRNKLGTRRHQHGKKVSQPIAKER